MERLRFAVEEELDDVEDEEDVEDVELEDVLDDVEEDELEVLELELELEATHFIAASLNAFHAALMLARYALRAFLADSL